MPLTAQSAPAAGAVAPAQGLLSVRSVAKRFGSTEVLRAISLEITEGEFLTILGESGSGKTTLLRLIAGFERADAGEIWMAGERLDQFPPNRRRVNTVFQHYALFPHLSVFENVAYGLRIAKLGDGEIQERTRARMRGDGRLADERATLVAAETALEQAREQRVHWQVEAAQMQARLTAARERVDRAGGEADQARRDSAALTEEVAQIDATSAELVSRRGQWQDALQERRVALAELEHATRAAATAVAAAEHAVTESEAAVEAARAALTALMDEEHRLAVERTELEGRKRATAERVEAEWRKPLAQLLRDAPEVAGDLEWLREENERLRSAIDAVGPVNALAVEEHAEETKRLEFLMTQRDDLVTARASLQQAAREIDQTAKALFLDSFGKVRENFRTVFQTLFGGGECDVRLANEDAPLESEIEIHAAPRGKRTQRIHLLSSGERTLVAVSLLFAIFLACPSPFCLLDEVDAPLDDANVGRYVRLLAEFKSQTQFIVITHNPRTMQAADAVYGVTMQEPGVSTIVGVRLGQLATA